LADRLLRILAETFGGTSASDQMLGGVESETLSTRVQHQVIDSLNYRK